MLDYAAARALVFEHTRPLSHELRPLPEARGFAAAKDLRASHPLPLFDNSAMDGYAVRSEEVSEAGEGGPVLLENLGYIPAGDPGDFQVGPGQCAQIATGAPVPPGADAVVMKEDVRVNGQQVAVLKALRRHENLRFRGEDIAEGRVIIAQGTRIGPAQISVLASFGFVEVPVIRPPSVSIVSTGNELVEVQEQPGPGQLRESNRYMLQALIEEENCPVDLVQMAPDDPGKLREIFAQALEADLMLISGGMSVGDHDFTKSTFAELGIERLFWKIRVKPGKPLFFGRRGDTLVFGLPGNPSSSYVLFGEFVRPTIRKMMGLRDLELPMVNAVLAEPVSECIPRMQFLRAQLWESGGEYRVRQLPFQGSNSIGSLVDSNALIQVEPNTPGLPAGTRVRVRPLNNSIVLPE